MGQTNLAAKGSPSTVAGAAKILGVSQETVRRYIREGKLKAEKKKSVGLQKVWLISLDEIRRLQEQ